MDGGFDIKLYCMKMVFWWQFDQAHVISCGHIIHYIADGRI